MRKRLALGTVVVLALLFCAFLFKSQLRDQSSDRQVDRDPIPSPSGKVPPSKTNEFQTSDRPAIEKLISDLMNELREPKSIAQTVKKASGFEEMLQHDLEIQEGAKAVLLDKAAPVSTRCFLALALLRSAKMDDRRRLLAELRKAEDAVLVCAFYGCSFRRSPDFEKSDQREEIWLGLLLKPELREFITPRFAGVYLSERFGVTLEEAGQKPLSYKLGFPAYASHDIGIEDSALIAEARSFVLGSADLESRHQVLRLIAKDAPEATSVAVDVYKASSESMLLRRAAANMIGFSKSGSRIDILISLLSQESDDEARAHLWSVLNAQRPKEYRTLLAQRVNSVDRSSKEYEVCVRALGRTNDLTSLELMVRHFDSAPEPTSRGLILEAIAAPSNDPGILEIKRSLVLRGLNDSSPAIRRQALNLAKQFGRESFLEQLRHLSEKDPDPAVRNLAKQTLTDR